MLRFWKNVGRIVILPLIMSVAVLLLSKVVDFYNLGMLIIGIVLYAIVYVIISWKCVMTDYERSLIQIPLSKVQNMLRIYK